MRSFRTQCAAANHRVPPAKRDATVEHCIEMSLLMCVKESAHVGAAARADVETLSETSMGCVGDFFLSFPLALSFSLTLFLSSAQV